MGRFSFGALYDAFIRYCAMTPLHGFSFIASAVSQHPCDIVIWFLAVVVCFIMCFRDGVNFIELYLAEPTAIAVRADINESFYLADASLCFDVNFTEYVAQQLAGVNESAFNQTLATFTASGQLAILQTGNTASIEQHLLNGTVAKSFIATGYLLLVQMMDYDRQVPQSTLQAADAAPASLRLGDVLEAYLLAAGVSFHLFASFIGAAICSQMGPYVTYFATSGPQLLVTQCTTLSSITWIGPPGYLFAYNHVVCALYEGVTMYASPFDTSFAYAHPEKIYAHVAGIGVNFYFDPRGGQGARDAMSQDGLIQLPVYSTQSSSIRIVAMFEKYNHSADPCSGEDPFICAEQALYAQIEHNRGCASLIYFADANSSTTLPPCTTRYTLAEASATTAAAGLKNFEALLQACPMQCRSTMFGFRQFTSTSAVGAITNSEITCAAVVHPIFTEYISFDFPTMLTAFGGSMCVWLGASIIAFVQLLVYLLDRATIGFLHHLHSKTAHLSLKHVEHPTLLYIKRYSKQTMLHGFRSLGESGSGPGFVFWIILIIASFAAATVATIGLVQQYLSVPTAISISVQTNKTLALDDVGLCVQFARASFYVEKDHSLAAFNATLDQFIASGQLGVLQTLINAGKASSGDFAALNGSVLKMTYMTLRFMMDYDTGYTLPMAQFGNLTLEKRDLVSSMLAASSIDLFGLVPLFGSYFCYRFNVTAEYHAFDPVTSQYNTSSYDPCATLSLFTYVGTKAAPRSQPAVDFICLLLPPNMTTFSTHADYTSAMVNDTTNVGTKFFLDMRASAGHIDSYLNDGEIFLYAPGNFATAPIVKGEFHQYNRATSECDPSGNLYICHRDCYSKNVSATRGCWPLSFFQSTVRPAGVPPCTDYYNISYGVPMGANSTRGPAALIYKYCASSVCQPSCVARAYNYQTSATRHFAPAPQSLVKIEIHQASTTYLVYEEAPVMFWDTFFWAFGGVVGLWIGGSMPTLLHLAVHFVISCVHGCFTFVRHKLRLQQKPDYSECVAVASIGRPYRQAIYF